MVRKMLLAIAALAAAPACAPAGQGLQGPAPVATVAPPQRGLSPALRQRIRHFVARRFREEGIGRDLLEGTLAGIDHASGRPSIGVRTSPLRAIRAYPSVATQISWQRSLGRIAGEFRLTFPSRSVPRPMVRIEGQIDPIPRTAEILWAIPNMIERAQGTFSEHFYARPMSELPGRPSGIRRAFAGWTCPLRINVRRVPGSDEVLARALARFRTMHPEGPIDDETSPSAPATANVFIAPHGRDWTTVDAVFACLTGMRCLSLHDAAFGYGTVAEPRPARGRADAIFFDHLYLTNPYGYRGSASALLQVDDDGHIVSAFCGAGDVGFEWAGGPVRTDAEVRLLSCLNEIMSPGSTRAAPRP